MTTRNIVAAAVVAAILASAPAVPVDCAFRPASGAPMRPTRPAVATLLWTASTEPPSKPPDRVAAVDPAARAARRAVRSEGPNRLPEHPVDGGGLLYVSTARGIVAALDPESGKVVWQDLPPARAAEAAPGRALRGVAYWTDGRDERILAITGQYLVALNAKTGKRYSDFGDTNSGDVDLTKGYDYQAPGYRGGGPPLVVGDIVVIGGLGGAPGENTGRQRGNQGDIRATTSAPASSSGRSIPSRGRASSATKRG